MTPNHPYDMSMLTQELDRSKAVRMIIDVSFLSLCAIPSDALP